MLAAESYSSKISFTANWVFRLLETDERAKHFIYYNAGGRYTPIAKAKRKLENQFSSPEAFKEMPMDFRAEDTKEMLTFGSYGDGEPDMPHSSLLTCCTKVYPDVRFLKLIQPYFISIFDQHDKSEQSEMVLSMYKQYYPEKGTGHLKTYMLGNWPMVENKYNPGRRFMLPFASLVVGQVMYFGEEAYAYLPKEKLLAYRHTLEKSEEPDGMLRLKLFEDYSDISAVREAQKRFIDEFGLLEMEEKLTKRKNITIR